MNYSINTFRHFLIAAATLFGLTSQPLAADWPVSVEIEIERLSSEEWQVQWSFSEAIDAFRVYPAHLGFRARSWRLISDDLEIEETDEGAVLSQGGRPFKSMIVRFSSDAQFEPATYVPVLPFSAGGAAVYSGHFSGDAHHDNEWHAIPARFVLKGQSHEYTLLPEWASELSPVYFYFGQQQAAESEQLVMIADSEMPQWLRDTFARSVPAVTKQFSELLGFRLEDKPLVFISAGQLRDTDGYSVKGAGLDRQFTVMLQGRALSIGSRERERMFEKMLAHELLHVWQQAMPGGEFNPEQPWLHEGSAEALAAHGLHAAGIWTSEELHEFHRQQQQSCSESLAGSELSEAADNGNWDAIYACGYLEFTEGVNDPFTLWQQLTRRALESGSPYTQQLLESVRAGQ